MKFKENFKGSMLVLTLISSIILSTYLSFNKKITININGQASKIDTISTTVGGVLSSQNITLEEGSSLEPSLDTKIEHNMEINIVNKFKINIEDNGTKTEYVTNQNTVGDILKDCNISLGEKDILSKGLDERIDKDEVIEITRVEEKIIVETKSIPFETETVQDESVVEGKSEVHTEGKNGIKEVTYKITYNNDKEVSKEKVSEQITKMPIKEIIKEGNLEAHSM